MPKMKKINKTYKCIWNKGKQAGAELGQAQQHVGLLLDWNLFEQGLKGVNLDIWMCFWNLLIKI